MDYQDGRLFNGCPPADGARWETLINRRLGFCGVVDAALPLAAFPLFKFPSALDVLTKGLEVGISNRTRLVGLTHSL